MAGSARPGTPHGESGTSVIWSLTSSTQSGSLHHWLSSVIMNETLKVNHGFIGFESLSVNPKESHKKILVKVVWEPTHSNVPNVMTSAHSGEAETSRHADPPSTLWLHLDMYCKTLQNTLWATSFMRAYRNSDSHSEHYISFLWFHKTSVNLYKMQFDSF